MKSWAKEKDRRGRARGKRGKQAEEIEHEVNHDIQTNVQSRATGVSVTKKTERR